MRTLPLWGLNLSADEVKLLAGCLSNTTLPDLELQDGCRGVLEALKRNTDVFPRLKELVFEATH